MIRVAIVIGSTGPRRNVEDAAKWGLRDRHA